MLLLFIPFKKITFIYLVFFSIFSFVHPFLQNCFCSISFVVSHLFSHLFFQSCSFEQEKLTPFFFWQKNNFFKTSKNFFSEILSFDVFNQKIFHRFSIFFWNLFLKNLFFFEFRTKNPTKWHLQPTMFVPISFSDNLFVLRRISVSAAFYEKCILSSPSCVSYRSKVFLKKKTHSKKCFLKKQIFFYLLLIFAPSCFFFFESKNSFLFFNCPFNFFRLCFSLFSFSVWFFLVSFIFFFEFVQTKIF